MTDHLEANRSFSFIRLGDGEVYWLLAAQDGEPPPKYRYDGLARTAEYVRSTSGLEQRHFARFVAALEGADYLDYCDSIPYVRDNLPKLRFRRSPERLRNASAVTSNILFDWCHHELHDYLTHHRCLFAGAEASLLQALCDDERYRALAKDFIPPEADIAFHQVHDDGRQYSENLDRIKDDLVHEIKDTKADTLLLSLATGAKILCYEIARDLGVRAIDFGSMMRALTYSGAPGYQAIRSLHNPFFFRVPMEIYMPAIERAWGDSDLTALIARAHAQAVLELQDLQPKKFNTADGAEGGKTDLSPNAKKRFRESLAYYNKKYRLRALADRQARSYHWAFVYWRLKKGLGVTGRTFQVLLDVKRYVRQMHRSLRAVRNI